LNGEAQTGVTDVKPPSPSLLKALADADWERLLPRLASYAERSLRRVGWAQGKDREPNRMSVMEAVNEGVQRALDGRRRWNDDSPPELEAFLCGVIRSLVSDERKAFRRDKTVLDGETADAAPDPTPLRDGDESDGEDDVRPICVAVEACARGDEDLELFRLAVLEGSPKREAVAAVLDWPPERVSAARTKLQRRLTARFPEEFASAKKKRSAS
jgi:hypothetical protein